MNYEHRLNCTVLLIVHSSQTENVVKGPRPMLWRWHHRATLCWLTSLLIPKCSSLGFSPGTWPSPSLKVIQTSLKPSFIHPHVFTPPLLICFCFFSYQLWRHIDCRQRSHHLSPSPEFLSPCCGLQVDHQGLPPPPPTLFLHQRNAEAALWEPSCSVAPLSSSIRTLLLQQLSTMLLCVCVCVRTRVCVRFTHGLFGCTAACLLSFLHDIDGCLHAWVQ